LAKDTFAVLVVSKTWDLPHLWLFADSAGVKTNVFPFSKQHVPDKIGVYLGQNFALHYTLLRVALIVSTG
jgi:hypothetical protein